LEAALQCLRVSTAAAAAVERIPRPEAATSRLDQRAAAAVQHEVAGDHWCSRQAVLVCGSEMACSGEAFA